MADFIIRKASKEDASLILKFIQELADYEKLSDNVVATVQDIEKTLFGHNPRAEVLILETHGEPMGFALFFYNYSTFLCKYGIYIEDLYVREKGRGKGYGKAFFSYICQIARENDCGRVEWWCLDWNKPSIDFYLKRGAEPMSDFTVYRLDQEKIRQIAEEGCI